MSSRNAFIERTQELLASGLAFPQAAALVNLEQNVARWPEEWGNSFQILIRGDFTPPDSTITVPELGITIHPEKLEHQSYSEFCVLRAVVSVPSRSVESYLEATQRISDLLGLLCVVDSINGPWDWWCSLTERFGSGGGHGTIYADYLTISLHSLGSMPPAAARKVRAALYWIREPKAVFRLRRRADVLKEYAGLWNAFECLVAAIDEIVPAERLSKPEKQSRISELIRERGGTLSPEDIEFCYTEVVNTGLKGKASHALRVCFAAEAATDYARACFERIPKQDRLYNVRNSINHGEIDGENPLERARVSARYDELQAILLGMFAAIGIHGPIFRPGNGSMLTSAIRRVPLAPPVPRRQ